MSKVKLAMHFYKIACVFGAAVAIISALGNHLSLPVGNTPFNAHHEEKIKRSFLAKTYLNWMAANEGKSRQTLVAPSSAPGLGD